jgi:polysaccharide export outer membrane protein
MTFVTAPRRSVSPYPRRCSSSGKLVAGSVKPHRTFEPLLHHASGQDVDFVYLVINESFWNLRRLLLIASFTFCLALFPVSRMNAQTPDADSSTDPISGSQTTPPNFLNPQSRNMSNMNGNAPASQTNPSLNLGDQDISPQRRRQDDSQQRTGLQILPRPLPTEFQKIVSASTGKMLPIFGANLFNTTPSTFAPVDNIPVTPDYVIGPGDELKLQIWGQVNQHGSFIVDRTGSISLPEVGTLHVAGLQFSQLNDFLKSQLGRVYRNFDLNTNLGQLRSIQVFVTGQVRQPGSFTIGSLSTLLNALFASGGPLPQGSLRDIQVKRGTQTVTHFDLYDLLLHGDKSKDVPLQSGDVIFIPNVGPQVAVLGSVTNPAVYELLHETSFNQVISLAGGLTNVAAGSQLRVERIADHAQRSELTIDLANDNNLPAQNGDIISVNAVIDRFQNAVTLRGNVANPGRYVWHQGMHVSDLIPDRETLITRNYYERQDRLGQVIPADNRGNNNRNSYGVNNQTGNGTSNQRHNQNNNLTSNQIDDQSSNQGSANPDLSGTAREGSLGMQAGAASDTAANRGTSGANGGGNSVGTTLTAGSRTFTPANDVILSAPDIDWAYAVIERQDQTTLQTSLVPFNLGKVVLDKDKSQDLELLNGDVVTIFSKADVRVPNSQQTKFVKLEGEFVASGVYSVLPGETLRQLLIREGGFTPDAYLYASEFTRESVRRVERQRILEYADSLESDISARSASLAASALTDRDAAAAQASAAEARATVARLRQSQPTGRIVFQLSPNARDMAVIPDLPLEDGDRFVVPKKPSDVAVQGQVYDANSFIFQSGKRVKDYLHLAGGPDRNADRRREFILRADGSVVSRQYSSLAQRGLFADRSFDDIPMLPGDTIVVPPNVVKGSVLRNVANIANIIEGFGIGAAAVEVLK